MGSQHDRIPNVYLLTGRPGIGKTTVIRRIVEAMTGRCGGFYTEEIRSQGTREGFRIVTLDGRAGIMAHVDNPSRRRVSKYGVDVAAIDALAVGSIREALRDRECVVIDEIGSMELFSPQFRDAVQEAVAGEKTVLGTIQQAPDPFRDRIRHLPNVQIIEVTLQNRDELPALLLAKLRSDGTARSI